MVLGNYVPKAPNEASIRRQINRLVKSKKFQREKDAVVEVRSPREQRGQYRYYRRSRFSPYRWHRDNVYTGDWVLLWTNKTSTLIRHRKSKGLIKYTEGDLVLFDNQFYEHKAPNNAPTRKRWFVRLIMNKPTKHQLKRI